MSKKKPKKKTPKEIVAILNSIKDVRLNTDNEVEILFEEASTTFPDGWEPNRGFVYNSFTQRLLQLIEDTLKGEVV